VADLGAGTIVFLVALFFAVIGATMFVVAMRRGVSNERPPDEH